ncbi:MAG: DnaJ family domain-containing protein [Candidatus Sericytochromatia bacterium]
MIRTMEGFENLVEQRIQEALRAGLLDNLPGQGKPLQLDDDSHIPPEARMAHRILKNAGVLPEEMQLRTRLAELEALVKELPPDDLSRRRELLAKIDQGRARYEAVMARHRRR